MVRRIAGVLALCFISLATTLNGQEGRTLHWRSVDVNARLDAEGRLHVRERQAMVFSGDWNGGERVFDIRPGQKLDFHGMTRIDPNGDAHALQSGGLDVVDYFDFTDSETLRWRSRLPTDPAFVNQEIIYELDYTLSDILTAKGDAYRLDHDFGFPARDGVIEQFSLEFGADEPWQSATALPLRVQRTYLEPGTSVVVTVPLRFTGAGSPSGVQRGLALPVRLMLVLALLGILTSMLRRFFGEERARGRFEPLFPVASIDEVWLRQHIFSMQPEVVGAIWDNTTSAPEVAAMISRMVLEGKLVSRVESSGSKDVLHLELKVPRADLPPDERRLINALFEGDHRTTDTDSIKERYENTGFDPAALINEGIQRQVKAFSPNTKAPRNWSRFTINLSIVFLVAITGVGTLVRAQGSPVMAAPIAVAVLGFVSLILSGVYARAVHETMAKARRMVVFLLLSAAPVIALALGAFEAGALLEIVPLVSAAQVSLSLIVILIVMFLGIAYLVLQGARTSDDSEHIELRRTLCAGREYFVHELAKPNPKLEDNWYPYLLAFGLGKHIDKWFEAFAGRNTAGLASSSGMVIASGSGGGWSGGGPLFGGGGGFGGGGTGRTWAGAATALSSGVSAPSSSSSSGGGSSGGSSGGGGGGGW